MAEQQQQTNITPEGTQAIAGLNMDQTVNQIPRGKLTYALNAAVENFDANSVNYQNEPGNELCLNFPEGYRLIGTHFIVEQSKHIFFLVNPETGDSQIGYMDNNDCVYHTYINAKCLNFDINHPIHKVVHKITNCTTEIYWTDGINPRRFLDLNKIPYVVTPGENICENTNTTEIDCNKLKMQPNFSIPKIVVTDVTNTGSLTAGTYQFAIQYCDVAGDAYTSYYSVTNPTPIADTQVTTPEFNYPVGKAIVFNITGIDTTGYFQYYNVAVIKTINGITSVELIGTYFIDDDTKTITYSGQNQAQVRLTVDDIFEKFPYYDIAQDLTAVQDILVWDNLTSIDRINYQQIASKINLYWQTYALPSKENYADELNATNLRGYLRDEVYAFEIVFLLKNGKQTDGFHIPGREMSAYDRSFLDVPETNPDFIGDPTYYSGGLGYSPYWKIYNTANVIGPGSGDPINNATPYQYGNFAYWESTETYPCNVDQWGELAGQPIRHHKFPDVLVSPIFNTTTPSIIVESGKYNPASLVMDDRIIYPIGVRFDPSQINFLISTSSLTDDQKSDIVGYKIVRGDRSTNHSIVGKGILRNIGKYNNGTTTEYFFPNYPYNDLNEDPFLLVSSGAYGAGAGECTPKNYYAATNGSLTYIDCETNTQKTLNFLAGQNVTFCSVGNATVVSGTAYSCGVIKITYDGCCSGYAAVQYYQCGDFSYHRVYVSDPNVPVFVCACSYSVYWGTAIVDTNPPYYQYILSSTSSTTFSYVEYGTGVYKNVTVINGSPVTVLSYITPYVVGGSTLCGIITNPAPPNPICYPDQLDAFNNSQSAYRHVFNSPETSFGQPFLGNILKLENVLYGKGNAHFVEVLKHAYYKFITREAQDDALFSSFQIGGTDITSVFAAYQAYLTIYINGITRRNYANSYNTIAKYSYWSAIQNGLGVKQRPLDIKSYLIPGVQNVGDINNVNNFQRESSVYLRTDLTRTALPVPSKTPSLLIGGVGPDSLITDKSRYTISSAGQCDQPQNIFDIQSVLYYGSLKTNFVNQWGQIYSYSTIDTGYQIMLSQSTKPVDTVFGGDTFINKFSFKTKLPFFIDNRVGAPDDSDVFYDELYNVAYPKYFFSSRSILYNYPAPGPTTLSNIVSIKAHLFDCPNSQVPKDNNPNRTYYDGKMYLFAYGIPIFYCESSINVDLRQAFNNKEGDFYPHVSTGIPDNWLQESVVPIAFDNTYYYNISYSKQNKENFFSHLPLDWKDQLCYTNFPFRAIYSERQQSFTDNRINSWLIYRPISFFDFPQNYGKLTSLDGIQNRAVLARFENKSLLYNTLLTVETSNPQAAYLGNDTLFKSAPPVDFAETDLGYVGSQNKMLLKIPQGQITADAKRGQLFLISGGQITDMTSFGSGVNRFFTDHLAFEILRYFPEVNTDNHFNGVGLHGVYDSKYDRIIITKLDYIPLNKDIKYDPETYTFYIERVIPQEPIPTPLIVITTSTTTTMAPLVLREPVELTDPDYFCDKSWTLSYNMNTNSWISFHTYIPNWYIGESNFFYSGLNTGCDFDALAAEIVNTTTTTSTTTTIYRDCQLDGHAEELYCELAGTAVIWGCELGGEAVRYEFCELDGTAIIT